MGTKADGTERTCLKCGSITGPHRRTVCESCKPPKAGICRLCHREAPMTGSMRAFGTCGPCEPERARQSAAKRAERRAINERSRDADWADSVFHDEFTDEYYGI